MRDGVAGAHEEFIIKLEGALSHPAMEVLYESDIRRVVSVFDEQSEEGSELWYATESTSPGASLWLALANEDFREEDLLEERISFCLVVNLEMIDFQVIDEIFLIMILLAVEIEALDSKQGKFFSPVDDFVLEQLLDFSNQRN